MSQIRYVSKKRSVRDPTKWRKYYYRDLFIEYILLFISEAKYSIGRIMDKILDKLPVIFEEFMALVMALALFALCAFLVLTLAD